MNAHLAIPSPPQALLSTSLPSNCEDPPCPADMIQLEDPSHGLCLLYTSMCIRDRARAKGPLAGSYQPGMEGPRSLRGVMSRAEPEVVKGKTKLLKGGALYLFV
ncbi:hypothetical protein CRG98_001419 [Punica granatum]|uniref:Uncharacterized protein n=1 Tax=Punica granatum TaxID=22663 RepID=A0A2I0LBX7_PUNGR|nr:hypothetical protein CRG98_001419 [Punica granatum]